MPRIARDTNGTEIKLFLDSGGLSIFTIIVAVRKKDEAARERRAFRTFDRVYIQVPRSDSRRNVRRSTLRR